MITGDFTVGFTVGYNCAYCGCYVPSGVTHTCGYKLPPPDYTALLVAVLNRIATALEAIEEQGRPIIITVAERPECPPS